MPSHSFFVPYLTFGQVSLTRTLQLHPRFFGPKLRPTLIAKLHKEVEGTCLGEHGYVILVLSVDEIGFGKVIDGTSLVSFPVKFKAVVCRPFKGEVLDAVVTDVIKHGINAEAGPLKIFVSAHNLPGGMEFDDTADPPRFAAGRDLTISRGDAVRLRIIGSRFTPHEIVCYCPGFLSAHILCLL